MFVESCSKGVHVEGAGQWSSFRCWATRMGSSRNASVGTSGVFLTERWRKAEEWRAKLFIISMGVATPCDAMEPLILGNTLLDMCLVMFLSGGICQGKPGFALSTSFDFCVCGPVPMGHGSCDILTVALWRHRTRIWVAFFDQLVRLWAKRQLAA